MPPSKRKACSPTRMTLRSSSKRPKASVLIGKPSSASSSLKRTEQAHRPAIVKDTSFPLFLNFPAEIQAKIWDQAIPRRRIQWHATTKTLDLRHQRRPPVVAHVCKAARAEALRFAKRLTIASHRGDLEWAENHGGTTIITRQAVAFDGATVFIIQNLDAIEFTDAPYYALDSFRNDLIWFDEKRDTVELPAVECASNPIWRVDVKAPVHYSLLRICWSAQNAPSFANPKTDRVGNEMAVVPRVQQVKTSEELRRDIGHALAIAMFGFSIQDEMAQGSRDCTFPTWSGDFFDLSSGRYVRLE